MTCIDTIYTQIVASKIQNTHLFIFHGTFFAFYRESGCASSGRAVLCSSTRQRLRAVSAVSAADFSLRVLDEKGTRTTGRVESIDEFLFVATDFQCPLVMTNIVT